MSEMKRGNIIQEKTFRFACDIVVIVRKINSSSRYDVVCRQLLKSGTSIGANVEEAIGAQSTKDFFTKLTIAYKEARETAYWLKLMKNTSSIDLRTANELLDQVEEILRIIGAIQKAIKLKNNI